MPVDGPPALTEASRREHALYRELADAYAALASVFGDAGAVDVERMAAADARADAAAAALRATAAALAPYRLTGASVSEDMRALWRSTARLAAEVARAHADLVALADARRTDVVSRLGELAAGRCGLTAYRPGRPAGGVADQRA